MAFPEKVALVHGGGIHAVDGRYALRPGSVARAERAAELFREAYVNRLVMSGGNGTGLDLPVSEAVCMADLAMGLDVPSGAIECETESSSTIGNWAESASILKQVGAERVVGVTGMVASGRARMIGERMINHYGLVFGLVGYVSSREPEGLRAYPRELVSAQMARRCLSAAEARHVPIEQLDAFYAGWKTRTGLVHVKRNLTRR